MEAVPRLPMLACSLKVSPEPASFGPKLKQYIALFYHEDPDTYTSEIRQLETLRESAVRPAIHVSGCQLLKKYFCQLHFLQSRFPMGKGEPCDVSFSWRDSYANMVCTVADIKFEMVAVLYNIGALHTKLGAAESRITSDSMKIACTHFQCAAWAFQYIRQNYPQPSGVDSSPEIMQYMYQLCLAQAQECILEKSMLDNRKATIIAKVAVQVVDFYNQALNTLQSGGEDGTIAETFGSKTYKDCIKCLKLKIAYHSCISFLYQGQQAEEQQKMGERVAFYHAASQELENARKFSKNYSDKSIITEALNFTMDVVEGKKKAATNENEFIYHEEVPERDTLQLVKGASLVKGIPFNFNDVEVSGPDIFARLVPMQAHEASSLYSEEKAQLLRRITSQVDEKDAQLSSYCNSLQLDTIEQAAQVIINGVKMTDLPQEIVDRAAQLSTKPDATKRLVDVMATLANLYHDVESALEEINQYLQEEEVKEKDYQTVVGVSRPPSMVTMEMKREANKYSEAHSKANESNQTLHRAMTLHINNLKLLALPLDELRQHIPIINTNDANIDIEGVKELFLLINKIDEMRKQRSTLVAQLRDSIANDDVTERIVTKSSDQPLDALFAEEMQKHQSIVKLIEQNMVAQENIMQAMTDAYARHSNTRKTIIDLLKHRETTIQALASSYDAYEDLITKATKGIDFYTKLETNVSKLLQRVKSTCKVQEEEREVNLAKNNKSVPTSSSTNANDTNESRTPKLKDYLANMKRESGGGVSGNVRPVPSATPTTMTYYNPPSTMYDQLPTAIADIPPVVVPSVRPAPVGSEGTNDVTVTDDKTPYMYGTSYPAVSTYAAYNYPTTSANVTVPTDLTIKNLEDRMSALMGKTTNYYGQQTTYMNPSATYMYPNPVSPNQTYPYQTPHYGTYTNQSNYDNSNHTQQYPNQYSATVNPTQLQQYQTTYSTTNQPLTSIPTVNSSQQPTNPTLQTNISSTNQPQQYSTPYVTSNPVNYDLNTSQQQITPSQIPYANVSAESQPQQYQNPYNNTSIDNLSQKPNQMQQYQSTYNTASNQPINQTSYANTSSTNQPQQYTNPQVNVPTGNQSVYNPNQSVQQSTNQMQYTGINQTQQYQTPYTNLSVTNQPQQPIVSTQQYQSPYPSATVQSHGYQISYVNVSSESTSNQIQPYQTQTMYANQPQQATDTTASVQQEYTSVNPYSYQQHPGYGYDSVTGQYVYSSGFQNSNYQSINNRNSISTSDYTNAGKNTTTQLTSNQYNSQQEVSTTETNAQNYYYMPYGHKGQDKFANPYSMSPQSPLTYMNSNNSNFNTTNTSSKSVITTEENNKIESNIDLLSDIDFNIPYTPLTPQVKSDKEYIVVEKEKSTESNKVTPKSTITDSMSELTNVDLKQELSKSLKKDPLADIDVLNQFTLEIEKFEKFVENLTNKTLNGPTPLDLKWKELQDLQDREAQHLNISVARCYPIKNRFPDILPYDHSRVEMPSTKDDYINASHVKNISRLSPNFILTQAPLQTTLSDFWIMIWEQQCEIIVCLLNDSEIQDNYFPREKGQDLIYGRFKLSLESCNTKPHWVERTITMSMLEPKMSRVIIHLQFTAWPGISFPTSPGPFLAFVCELLTFHYHQRNFEHPILVHCDSGIGRSGLLCLLTSYVTQPAPLFDIVKTVAKISQQRKQALRDREHLKFAYQAILYHAQDLLMKRGILTSRSSFEESIKPKTHTRHPSQDLLIGSTTQSNTERTINQSNSEYSNGRRGSNISQSSIVSDCSSTSADNKLRTTKSKSVTPKDNDPLLSLDPLWTLKKS